MSERYTRVFSLQSELYAKGSPVIIKAGALLLDNVSGKTLAQLKFQNISTKTVKLIKVKISSRDSMGREIAGDIEYEYLDLSAKRDEEFGSKAAIFLPDSKARYFSVELVEVGFTDNTIWSCSEKMTTLPAWQTLESRFYKKEQIDSYKARFGKNAKFAVQECSDIWYCSCGVVNKNDEKKCHKCGCALVDMKNADPDELYKDGVYIAASTLSKSDSIDDLEKAGKLFKSIPGWKNADEQIIICQKKVEELKVKAEIARREAERIEKRNKKITIIATLIVCAIIGFIILGVGIYNSSPAGTFEYHKTDDGGICIDTLKDKKAIELVIPNEISGRPVTSIGESAFSDCIYLTSITIPDSVTSIGDWAFRDCSKLTSITIPDSVTSIGFQAFFGCSSLKSIEIPDSVTSIGEGAFEGCSSLRSITIPNSVTSIGYATFKDCSKLTSVSIPDSVTSIDEEAFYGCNSLVKLVIAEGSTTVTSTIIILGSQLTSVVIPDSVTSIGDWAFRDCSKLTSITIPDSVTSIGFQAFFDCRSLKSIEIPDSVTSIGEGAFQNCRSLTSINIPDGETSIGQFTFYGCSNLKNIVIPDSVTRIGKSAFNECSRLASVTIGNGVTSIGDYAFYKCGKLTSIVIPDSVTSIGEGAFWSCSKLTSVTIGNGVTSIGYAAFYDCRSLKNILIPDSVTSIGDFALCIGSNAPDSVKFNGTKAQWRAIEKGTNIVNEGVPVSCSDGPVY